VVGGGGGGVTGPQAKRNNIGSDTVDGSGGGQGAEKKNGGHGGGGGCSRMGYDYFCKHWFLVKNVFQLTMMLDGQAVALRNTFKRRWKVGSREVVDGGSSVTPGWAVGMSCGNIRGGVRAQGQLKRETQVHQRGTTRYDEAYYQGCTPGSLALGVRGKSHHRTSSPSASLVSKYPQLSRHKQTQQGRLGQRE